MGFILAFLHAREFTATQRIARLRELRLPLFPSSLRSPIWPKCHRQYTTSWKIHTNMTTQKIRDLYVQLNIFPENLLPYGICEFRQFAAALFSSTWLSLCFLFSFSCYPSSMYRTSPTTLTTASSKEPHPTVNAFQSSATSYVFNFQLTNQISTNTRQTLHLPPRNTHPRKLLRRRPSLPFPTPTKPRSRCSVGPHLRHTRHRALTPRDPRHGPRP